MTNDNHKMGGDGGRGGNTLIQKFIQSTQSHIHKKHINKYTKTHTTQTHTIKI